jgi:PHD/YefM family antitoxin component YafN of YafNO toxin-antitoxin module
MRRVSSADLIRNFSVHSDEALVEPVLITRNKRDRLVMLNVERYRDILLAAVDASSGRAAIRAQLDKELEFLGVQSD